MCQNVSMVTKLCKLYWLIKIDSEVKMRKLQSSDLAAAGPACGRSMSKGYDDYFQIKLWNLICIIEFCEDYELRCCYIPKMITANRFLIEIMRLAASMRNLVSYCETGHGLQTSLLEMCHFIQLWKITPFYTSIIRISVGCFRFSGVFWCVHITEGSVLGKGGPLTSEVFIKITSVPQNITRCLSWCPLLAGMFWKFIGFLQNTDLYIHYYEEFHMASTIRMKVPSYEKFFKM